MKTQAVLAISAVVAVGWIGLTMGGPTPVQAQDKKIYELRTYYTEEGRLPALLARFRDHTTKLFVKHGMKNIGYWIPSEGPGVGNTLIYILQHSSRDAATKSWDAFRSDPEWTKVRTESEKDGRIVKKVESQFLEATDFSAIR